MWFRSASIEPGWGAQFSWCCDLVLAMDADEDNVSTLPRKSPSSYMTVRQTTSIRMALAVATILGIICDRRSRYPGGMHRQAGLSLRVRKASIRIRTRLDAVREWTIQWPEHRRCRSHFISTDEGGVMKRRTFVTGMTDLAGVSALPWLNWKSTRIMNPPFGCKKLGFRIAGTLVHFAFRDGQSKRHARG